MRPGLIHPTRVKIARLDRDATEWDPDFRTPKGEVQYKSPVEVKAQVRYNRLNQHLMTPAGESPYTSGRLVMLKEDYEAAGGFSKGDKIVEIDGFPTEAYIDEVRPAGHYTGGATLVMLLFSSRKKGP